MVIHCGSPYINLTHCGILNVQADIDLADSTGMFYKKTIYLFPGRHIKAIQDTAMIQRNVFK